MTSGHGPLSWGSTAWQKAALQNGGRRMLSTGGARSSQRKRLHPSHAAQPARQRGGLRLALQTAAGTMTLLLVSDGGPGCSACGLMAEALDQQGHRCITAGPAPRVTSPWPPLPLSWRSPCSNWRHTCWTRSPPLASSRRSRNRFSSSSRPIKSRSADGRQRPCSAAPRAFGGDALIRDLSLRMGCDLLLVSGDHQRRQLQSLASTGPPACRSRP